MRNKLGLSPSLVQHFSLKQKVKYAFWGAAIYGLSILALSFLKDDVPVSQSDIFYAEISSQSPFHQAGNSSNLYFLKIQTDYCEPCEYMEDKVLRNRKIADYVQTNFVPLKIDPLTFGEHLPAWVEKYETSVFPTYLILDSEGKEVKRMVGVLSATNFLEQLDTDNLKPEAARTNLASSYQKKRINRSFAIKIQEFNTYVKARTFAERYQARWDGEIWIDRAEGDPYQVLIGSYPTPKEAKIIATLIREMDQEQPEVVKLNKARVEYPANARELISPAVSVIP